MNGTYNHVTLILYSGIHTHHIIILCFCNRVHSTLHLVHCTTECPVNQYLSY